MQICNQKSKLNYKMQQTDRLRVNHLIAFVLLLSVQLNQITCTSSYIDDYFLPTAKLALNKIQQSFSPAEITTTTEQTQFDNATARQSSEQQSIERITNNSQVEYDTSGGKKVDEADSSATNSIPDEVGDKKLADDNQQPVVTTLLSSTESSLSDPTTTSATNQDSSGADQQQNRDATSELPESKATEVNQEEQTTLSQSSSEDTASPAVLVDQSVEQSSTSNPTREAELAAVAAVDASIAFGASTDLFAGSLTDSCYDEYGNARYCEPEFENIALERPVAASSECGQSASRFCTTRLEGNDQFRNCHICDQQQPRKRHPAAYLTDLNNPTSPTCWVSAPIGLTASGAVANKRDNVTLTLKLGKSYEITYVSLQFCSPKPDSLAILRSQDFGSTWQPYQFYSSQCKQMYGLEHQHARAEQPRFEPTCTDAHHQNSTGQANRIAFSTLEVLNTAQQRSTERPSQLLDWMTSTDLRIVLDRHQANWIQSNLGLAHHHSQAAANQATPTPTVRPASNSSQPPEQAVADNNLLNPSDNYNYAVSDLTVGGRCKCNGHASRCVHGLDGELQCDCRHNTAGRDCERCASFHFDRPWQPANQFDANPCQPCQCNGHSRRCRFDPEIFQLSGKRSGGVCILCQDNTAGRHCHYCVEGFTRDHARPMSDPRACKPCDCHPLGSLGRVCNQTTGQCPCKEGVTGLLCNRCAAGYQQSSSPLEPCIKLPENDINYEPTIEQAGDADQPTVENQDESQPGAAPGGVVSVGPEQATDHEPSIMGAQSELPAATTSGAAAVNQRKPIANEYPNQFAGEQTYQKNGYSFAHNYPYSRHQSKGHRHYLARPANKYHARPSSFAANDEDDPSNENNLAQQYQDQEAVHEYAPPVHRMRNYAQPNYAPRSLGGGRRVSVDEMIPLVDSVDEDPSSGLGTGGPEQMPPSMVDDSEFNQIGHQHQQHLSGAAKHRNHVFGGARRSGHHFNYEPQRRPMQGQFGPNQQRQLSNTNCADCQSATKRLTVRQFCNLDYAIKATVLNKHMSEDWTRVDVEIQDIFKSSNGNTVNQNNNVLVKQASRPPATRNFVAPDYSDTLFFQSDDPNPARSLEQQQQPATSNLTINAIDAPQTANYRLRIGSTQSIWVPTEDLSCKCPKLKFKSTYLLMGLIVSKDNPITSIQLDRHGVAMEWKSSLQDKLIKYQKRQARRGC